VNATSVGVPRTPNAGVAQQPTRKLGLVLGAGGMTGMAYHAGVLRALEQHAGIIPGEVDLLVGTSAGAVMAAYLRSGFSVDALWSMVRGTHPALEELGRTPEERRAATAFSPAFRNGSEFLTRAIGSSFVTLRSFARIPIPRLPDALHPLLYAGLFTMDRAQQRFELDLAGEWPIQRTAICAVDLGNGRRTVFGPNASPVSLADAVTASCSIPGFYSPFKSDGKTYVDGGVHSPTNLDVAARFGCDVIITIAPMAYDPNVDIPVGRRLIRRIGHRSLHHEAIMAKARGAEVLLIRPDAEDVRVQGINPMRASGAEAIALAGYESASRLLASDRFSLALEI
jgi:NTE family protein